MEEMRSWLNTLDRASRSRDVEGFGARCVRMAPFVKAVSNTKDCAVVPFHHSEGAPYMYASPPR